MNCYQQLAICSQGGYLLLIQQMSGKFITSTSATRQNIQSNSMYHSMLAQLPILFPRFEQDEFLTSRANDENLTKRARRFFKPGNAIMLMFCKTLMTRLTQMTRQTLMILKTLMTHLMLMKLIISWHACRSWARCSWCARHSLFSWLTWRS